MAPDATLPISDREAFHALVYLRVRQGRITDADMDTALEYAHAAIGMERHQGVVDPIRLRQFCDLLLDYGAASYELGRTGRIASDDRRHAHSRLIDLVVDMDRELRTAHELIADLTPDTEVEGSPP